MNFDEKTVETKQIFKGQIINVKVDTVELSNGKKATRELVEHPGGVGIIPINEKKEVLMVSQFRKPFNEMILEVPAGKLAWGEDPFECGVRELEEETGFCANKYIHLGEYYPTPGFCNEKINLYLATELYPSKQKLDEDEFLEVCTIPLDTLFDMVMENKIKDAKTAIAILKAKNILG
ncbi:MAG: NUDIX hydrolase [Clostridia bacterium]|nr:NUDIX hydrolase [Clostridia bacterium]